MNHSNLTKSLLLGSIVSGKFGPLDLPYPGARRRTRKVIVGRITNIVDEHEHEVLFQGYDVPITCKSSKLRLVPENEIPPTFRTVSDDIDDDPNGSISSDDDEDAFDEDYDLNEDEYDFVLDDLPLTQDSNETDDLEEEEEEEVEMTYKDKLSAALDRIKILSGTPVHVRTKSPARSIKWIVVDKVVSNTTMTPANRVGMRSEIIDNAQEAAESHGCLDAELFLALQFTDQMSEKLSLLNEAVAEFNHQANISRKVAYFSVREFYVALGLFVGSVCYAPNSAALWNNNDEEEFLTLEPNLMFEDHMKDYRFREFRRFFPCVYKNFDIKHTDPWWEFKDAVDEFNSNRLACIIPSNHICLDELMSAWRPQTTATGGLPNITHIPRKPEPLGTEFKCATCSQSGVMLHLELQRGKEGMRDAIHNRDIGNTAGCTLRLAEQV